MRKTLAVMGGDGLAWSSRAQIGPDHLVQESPARSSALAYKPEPSPWHAGAGAGVEHPELA